MALQNMFIHSRYFYKASSSSLLLRGAPDTARIPCQDFTPKRHRQLRVKDLPKVITWRLERDSNPRPTGQQLSTLSMSHHVPQESSESSYRGSVNTEMEFLSPNNMSNTSKDFCVFAVSNGLRPKF